MLLKQIDEERQRIALGMKKSYIEEAKNTEVSNGGAAMDDTLPASKQEELLWINEITDKQNDGAIDILLETESRALVLPLQVSLDDFENTHMESTITVNQDNANEATEIEKRKDRHMKKKEKQDR